VNGTNVIGLVVFSVALGIVIGKLGKAGEPLKHLFQSLNDAIILLVKAIMW
jgi:Na+/H+-dicarboxylate symporter